MTPLRPGPLATFAALLLLSAPALAQDIPPKIWDVPFGTPITALGINFAEPACGTNGGPPGVALKSFADFAQCQPEADGLREIWFRYDDTLEYLARAVRDRVQIIKLAFTKIGMQPAILSFLVDESGRIRGYRAHTDPAAEPGIRYDNHLASPMMRAVLAADGWTCKDLPRAEGESEIEDQFVKQRCTLDRGDLTAVNETRFYLKAGQAVLDPATGKPMLNAFESSASISVAQSQPYPADTAVIAETPAAPVAADQRSQFLAGLTNDCPDCDLSNSDLRRRDLTGADLTGARLVATNLHRAILRQAKLAGADLGRADLNLADITQTDFTGANLKEAVMFGARGAQTKFTDAILSGIRAGSLDIRQGVFDGADLTSGDFGQARLQGASLMGADLTGAFFYQAMLVRANFTEAKGSNATFNETVLRDANLSKSVFSNADFLGANLLGADLTDADFTHVRFERANLRDAQMSGTTLTGSLMPDGSFAK